MLTTLISQLTSISSRFLSLTTLPIRNGGSANAFLWPHFLIDEVIPLDLYPLIEDLWVDLEIRGDGYASWRTRVEDTFGKLNTPAYLLPQEVKRTAKRAFNEVPCYRTDKSGRSVARGQPMTGLAMRLICRS